MSNPSHRTGSRRGLPKEEEKPSPVARLLPRVMGRHKTPTGIEVITEPKMVEEHKLPEEARKDRRADNKIMKRSRELHRRRKRHGRH